MTSLDTEITAILDAHRWTFDNGHRGACRCGWTATANTPHNRHITAALIEALGMLPETGHGTTYSLAGPPADEKLIRYVTHWWVHD